MQIVIALVTVAVYLRAYHELAPAIAFYVVLQFASVLGVYWGLQMRKRRFQPHV
jgi:hypothetical protein